MARFLFLSLYSFENIINAILRYFLFFIIIHYKSAIHAMKNIKFNKTHKNERITHIKGDHDAIQTDADGKKKNSGCFMCELVKIRMKKKKKSLMIISVKNIPLWCAGGWKTFNVLRVDSEMSLISLKVFSYASSTPSFFISLKSSIPPKRTQRNVCHMYIDLFIISHATTTW